MSIKYNGRNTQIKIEYEEAETAWRKLKKEYKNKNSWNKNKNAS